MISKGGSHRTRASGRGPESAPAGESTILVVGTDRDLRQRLCSLLEDMPGGALEQAGFEANEEGFWSRWSSAAPALVVLDTGSDVEWGQRVLSRIKALAQAVPVVVLTTEVSRDFAERIISQGVVYYFTRDFLADEFLDVAKNLLKRSSAEPNSAPGAI